jgi:hypothetical protein
MAGTSGFMANRFSVLALAMAPLLAGAVSACTAPLGFAPVLAARQNDRQDNRQDNRQGAQAQGEERRRDRRPRLRSVGEPGRVAAADFTFARTAREEGLAAAANASVAPGALSHTGAGPLDAARWIGQIDAATRPAQWAPDSVWSSCDGTLAVSEGRYRQADGIVGTYVRVWALQGDRRYRWTYDLASPDNPQPPPDPVGDTPGGPDVIVVETINSLTGRVADCPRRGEERTPPTPQQAANAAFAGGGTSDDATLTWGWQHRPNGERVFTADYLRDGRWQRAVELRAGPEGAAG